MTVTQNIGVISKTRPSAVAAESPKTICIGEKKIHFRTVKVYFLPLYRLYLYFPRPLPKVSSYLLPQCFVSLLYFIDYYL